MKKRIQSDVIWKPETLREYSELAKEVMVSEDILPDACPLAYRINQEAALTLRKAVETIERFRMPESKLSGTEDGELETDSGDVFWEVREVWAFEVCYLWEYVALTMFMFTGNDFCERYWPRSPVVEAFGEVGGAALQVVEFFAAGVEDIIFRALKSACGKPEYDGLFPEFIADENIVLEPVLEPKAVSWRKGIKVGLAERFPSSEWPERRIELERRRLAVQLRFEVMQAEKQRKVTRDAGESSKKAPRRQKVLRREADIVAILEKNPGAKQADIAKELGCSAATVSRSRVWKMHRAKPPQKSFPDHIAPE